MHIFHESSANALTFLKGKGVKNKGSWSNVRGPNNKFIITQPPGPIIGHINLASYKKELFSGWFLKKQVILLKNFHLLNSRYFHLEIP